MLQPLVENALYHGIKEKEGQGHIKVSVQRQDTGLVIRIEDDGVGFKLLAIVVKVSSNVGSWSSKCRPTTQTSFWRQLSDEDQFCTFKRDDS